MAALTGNTVASSYQGLLKTTDNAVIGATEKNLTDGAGNASTLSVGTTSASFTGTLDLSGATVTGVDGLAPAGGTTDQVLAKVDGTDYNYAWTDASGGGGSTPAPFVAPANGTYSGGNMGPYTFFSNKIPYYPIWLEAGQELTVAQFEVTVAFTTANLGFAIYNTQNTTNVNGQALVPNEKLIDIGSVSGTTTGIKELTGFSFTPPYTGVYYIGLTIPGVWDGALGGYNVSSGFGNSDLRAKEQIQYGGIPGTFYGQFAQIAASLVGDGTSHPATWAANKSWSGTSAYIFIGLRTN